MEYDYTFNGFCGADIEAVVDDEPIAKMRAVAYNFSLAPVLGRLLFEEIDVDLPEVFNIRLTAANEYGTWHRMTIHGVKPVDSCQPDVWMDFEAKQIGGWLMMKDCNGNPVRSKIKHV